MVKTIVFWLAGFFARRHKKIVGMWIVYEVTPDSWQTDEPVHALWVYKSAR